MSARLRVVVLAVLLGVILVAALSTALEGCGPSRAAIELEGETVAGITTSGVRYLAPAWIDDTGMRDELAFELEAASAEEGGALLPYLVIVRSGIFTVARLRVGGNTDTERRVVQLAASYPNVLPFVASARHEAHHAALFRDRGNADPTHSDPSWSTLPATPTRPRAP